MALLIGLLVRPWDNEQRAVLGEPGTRPGSTAAPDAPETVALVVALQDALSSGSRSAARSLGDADHPDSATELDQLVTVVGDLGITDLRMRYVAPSETELNARQRQRFGPTAWVGDVEVSWRLAGFDDAPSSLAVRFVFDEDDESVTFVTARAPGKVRAPLWLVDKVAATRAANALVVSARGAQTSSLPGLVRTGTKQVLDQLPGWNGKVVVEAPRTDRAFASASGLSAASAQGIAAVTTTSDGFADLDSAVRIFVNPAVFSPLGEKAQQIVITHEMTHVALDAPTSRVPLWLSEGFADYVALRESDVPVTVLAAQVRGLVRKEGLPEALPGPADFDGADPDVGATYESAWLAARAIADTYGEDGLLRLYRRAARDGGTDRGFAALGTSEQAVVRLWRRDLADLAR